MSYQQVHLVNRVDHTETHLYLVGLTLLLGVLWQLLLSKVRLFRAFTEDMRIGEEIGAHPLVEHFCVLPACFCPLQFSSLHATLLLSGNCTGAIILTH